MGAEEESWKMIRIEALKAKYPIVIPRVNRLISSRIEVASKAIDGYFEELIGGYPIETQKLLRQMYFDKVNVVEIVGMRARGAHASWSVEVTEGEYHWEMTVDPTVTRSKILFKLNAVHEIGVHIGQAHQRISQVGFSQFVSEVNSGKFTKFTEISAAAAEKRILDAIPFESFVMDVVNSFPDRAFGQLLINDYHFRRRTPFDTYIEMHHRPGDGLTEQDVLDFKSRYHELEQLKE
jgi:hypothetical protein